MDLNDWYEKGISPDAYIELLEKHKDGFLHIYNNFNLPADEHFFQSVKEKNLRVVVLAEVWCGHCMLNIPVLFRLAQKTDMPVRILARDQHLELMDKYLTNEKRVIPIFIFIDQQGNEVAKWGPIAPMTKDFVDKQRAALPPKDSDEYKEKSQELFAAISKDFRNNTDFWNGAYEDIKKVL